MRCRALGLMVDADRLGSECARTDNEVKKLRRLLVGHAEVFLQLIKGSFSVAQAKSSLSKSWAAADAVPDEQRLQPPKEPTKNPNCNNNKKKKKKEEKK